MTQNKGLFISFEGIDGIGKSCQLKLLAKKLMELEHSLYITKEPGDSFQGSNIGKGIRPLLFTDPSTKGMGEGVADLLFLADHLQNSYDIANALKENKIVLCDRYADSQFAYSASPSKKTPEWANNLFVDHFGPVPDLTILFVAHGPITIEGKEDIAWALDRANARRGTESGKQNGKAWNEVEEQRKIQDYYLLKLAQEHRTVQVHVLEGTTIDEVHKYIMTEINYRFPYLNKE
jgi:dTMP kinase